MGRHLSPLKLFTILYVGSTPNWRLGFVQPFVILGFTKSLECWATVYYWLLWVIAISFFAFSGPFAKSVSKFFKSLQPSYREQQRKSREDKYKLNNEEASIVEQAVGAKLGQDYDIPALGLPPFDVFTDFDQTEVDHDIQHLRKAWTSFRGRRGSITENDFDGLKDAYNNFTNEINDIFNTKRKNSRKKNSTSKTKESTLTIAIILK